MKKINIIIPRKLPHHINRSKALPTDDQLFTRLGDLARKRPKRYKSNQLKPSEHKRSVKIEQKHTVLLLKG